MAKVTVAQLAQELKLKPSQLLHVLRDLGVAAESADVTLDDDTISTIKEVIDDLGDEINQLRLNQGVTPRELAGLLDVPVKDIQMKLMKMGELVGITQALKQEHTEKIVKEYGLVPVWGESEKKIAPKAQKQKKAQTGAEIRPPIVTILGHVDHGKTTLLDYIRKTTVASGEFGGITQHVGAYQAEVDGKQITFLDTPGHEAFSKMRARGAQVTDIAILVVAADDGIMPQTAEAINHAQAAQVEIIVALNKIDKPEANILKVQQQLSEYNLVPREWGGTTEMAPVSAKEGTGVDHLLETILLTAEILELRADHKATLQGTVIEARLDKGRGPLATILVQDGTLKIGDCITIGPAYGKIKAMLNYRGERVTEAGPSIPVQIMGLSEVPTPGDKVELQSDEKTARNIAEDRADQIRSDFLSSSPQRVSLQDLYRRMEEGLIKDLNIVLKADVGGSLEAIHDEIATRHNEEVTLKVIYSGVGNVTESDVDFADAAGAIVVGFNVKIEAGATALAERKNVEVRTYKVIYELIDDIEKALKGLLEPKFEEIILGSAQVRQVFKLTRSGVIAGCMVTDGKIIRNANARLYRDKEVVFTGKIDSLRHIKDDVKEMASGFECGIGFDNWNDLKDGDIIEAFEMKQIQ